jgi:SAM-dependent methyltransferase
MPTTPDQRELWIAQYGDTPNPAKPSAFVEPCLELLPAGARILELGCGTGTDAVEFVRAGHTVVATDFVPAVIGANRERHADLPTLTFQEMRIDEPFPFPDQSFDAVYAHLTLHYYPDVQTREIITEIRRVLAPSGWLMFACKSSADPAWGKGTEIEPDMFDFHGKVRHFFTADYARSLLESGFTAIDIQEHAGKLYKQKSGWITAIAQRPVVSPT